MDCVPSPHGEDIRSFSVFDVQPAVLGEYIEVCQCFARGDHLVEVVEGVERPLAASPGECLCDRECRWRTQALDSVDGVREPLLVVCARSSQTRACTPDPVSPCDGNMMRSLSSSISSSDRRYLSRGRSQSPSSKPMDGVIVGNTWSPV